MSEPSLSIKKLQERFAESIISHHSDHGDDTVVLSKDKVVEICTFLRDDPDLRYNFLMDLTAVDYLGRKPRFEVVYHLYSLEKKHRVRLKAQVGEESCSIDTVQLVWIAAGWFEREIWDMYGITFRGHPDLRRILLYKEFVGHPLRKDYPIDKRQPLVPLIKPETKRSRLY